MPKTTRLTKTALLAVRVTAGQRISFTKACEAHGGVSLVLRELILGFIEKRVKIAPPTNREGSLYHVD